MTMVWLRRCPNGQKLTWLLLTVLVAVAMWLWNWTFGCCVDVFGSPMDQDDIKSQDRTLRTVAAALDGASVTYFLTSGTLLGSYRHHGRIPWDDDVDLMVNSSDKQLVWKTLTQLMPDYGLFLSGTMDSPYHWIVYPRREGRYVPLRPFRWPFVDLLFFVENATHVWNGSPNFPEEVWPRKYVFPLRRRPFERLSLPAPCDTAAVLAINFDVEECQSRGMSHRYDLLMLQPVKSVQCSTLFYRHPFVLERRVINRKSKVGGRGHPPLAVAETLLLGNRKVRERVVLTGCR